MKFSQLINDNLTIKSECGKISLIFISGVMSGVTYLSHIKVYLEIHDKVLSKQGRKPVSTPHTLIVQLFRNPNKQIWRMSCKTRWSISMPWENNSFTFWDKKTSVLNIQHFCTQFHKLHLLSSIYTKNQWDSVNMKRAIEIFSKYMSRASCNPKCNSYYNM